MRFKFATIEVKDLEKSFKFYTDVLDLSLVRRFSPREGVEIIFLEDRNGNQLELIEDQNVRDYIEERASKVQLSYEVDSLQKTMRFLASQSVEIVGGPVDIQTGRFIIIEDPDGVRIGLFEENK
ncbi:VOC family protein [Halanaerobium hydrogeniformans]|uniref:Glyoxalase/bleomycin resistance protein/dioxygenase n=1 Tax=Halanaerobium hydrogeniformans TaxID=656519 RepID=E4RP85_HALHG|nr:VOC family protein [Halanaerobium hydrogeniformans]ADQ13910.1 Glyoxalase/bleomycin resistance protein/dioxygenase [Halanaerobium hydrogeniformans]